uniref:cAMP-independent regulatory protein pac2 n=1 Tax=Anthurium amnicola TaxID=1678845 RepID=A0A1D1XD02_9ARAE
METYYGYVKAPQDAIILFEACRLGFLNRIQRRLSEKERSQIRSGSVFVWDEREAGMRRWTDGKSWSASRVSGSFLTYRELESKRKSGSRGSNNLNDLSSEDTDSSESYQGKKISSTTEQCSRYKHGGLVKQSFSITASNHQKLHLICYYTKADVINNKLQIPSQDEKLKSITIPKGMYPETSSVDNAGHMHYAGQHHAHHHHPHHPHHPHHQHQHSHPTFSSDGTPPYPWPLHHHSHIHAAHRLSGSDPMQIDSHSACSTPSISSSPSTTEEDFVDFRRNGSTTTTTTTPPTTTSSTPSMAIYPPAKFIQPGGSDTSGYVGSAPINIPNGRFTFPQPQQLSFPSSYPPPTQLPPQDIRWDNTRNSEDQRQLNAIYTTLRL